MKSIVKLGILVSLLLGRAYAQPNLSMIGYSSYIDSTSSAAIPNLILLNVEIANVDPITTFSDTLDFAIGAEFPVGTVTDIGFFGWTTGPHTIPPLDTIVVDSVFLWIDTSKLQDGNNTVVIWPISGGATVEDSLYIYMNFASILSPKISIDPVVLAPNPCQDVVHLIYSTPQLSLIRIRDASGRIVETHLPQKALSVTHLPNGVYTLECISQSGSFVEKLVVQH